MGNYHKHNWQPAQEPPMSEKVKTFFVGDWSKVITLIITVLGCTYAFASRLEKVEWRQEIQQRQLDRLGDIMEIAVKNQNEVIKNTAVTDSLIRQHLNQKP